jgi:hypothetical protein
MIDWVEDQSNPIAESIDSGLHPGVLPAIEHVASLRQQLASALRWMSLFHWRSKTTLVPDGWPANPEFVRVDIVVVVAVVAFVSFPITVWALSAIARNWLAFVDNLNWKCFPVFQSIPAEMIVVEQCAVDPYCADRPVWPLALERSWNSTNGGCCCRPPDWRQAELKQFCPANPNNNMALQRSAHSDRWMTNWN